MARAEVTGRCNICGHVGKLSYEQVPPRAAFNDRKVLLASVEEYWNRGQAQGLAVRGQHLQRGHGAYTLCEKCNNTTGRLYGPHFVEWCRQGKEFYDRTKGKASVLHFQTIYPLPVIKQVVTMFLALSDVPGFVDANQKLVRFVLDREACYLDPRYRFWVYYVAPGPLRKTPFCAAINIETGQVTAGAEFSFPPFGYMMTLNSAPQDKRLFEITHFSRYRVSEMDRVVLNLEALPTHGPMIGDYRNFKDMERQDGDTNVVIGMR